MTQTNFLPRPADAAPTSWIYRWLPRACLPYAQLARLDRPIGFWLLLAPCWWALALAGTASDEVSLPALLALLALFAGGAIVMRAAGCVVNDIADRRLDAQVARTAARPLASGQLKLWQALLFLACLLGIGALILWQFNRATWWAGVAVLPLIALYPYVKRWSFWPQAVLGATFNWGALLGWLALKTSLAAPSLWLYAACLFWTLGYDTIYAEQDKKDDARIGLKSTALYFGRHGPKAVSLFYLLALGGIAAAAGQVGSGLGFWLCLPLGCAQLGWQIWHYLRAAQSAADVRAAQSTADSSALYLRLFKSNGWFALLIFGALALGMAQNML